MMDKRAIIMSDALSQIKISTLRIESLEEYEVPLSNEILAYLNSMYLKHYEVVMSTQTTSSSPELAAEAHVSRFRQRMKHPPQQTVLRLTTKSATDDVSDRKSLINKLQGKLTEWLENSSKGASNYIRPIVQGHSFFNDVITIDLLQNHNDQSSLYAQRVPHEHLYPRIFTDWPAREKQGWPVTHRAVVVDRLCGEAVLRGANVFVKGIVVADAGIRDGENLAVYVHVGTMNAIPRGMLLRQYHGHCVFLGMGRSCCDRSRFFSQSTGLGIQMSVLPFEKAGPVLFPLQDFLGVQLFAQNLPSIVVGHVLDPQPGDCIYDMCGAPGGKTSHLAFLTQGQATIVMSDKSRSKVVAAKSLFEGLGCDECIYPLHIDATKCVLRSSNIDGDCLNVKKILSNATRSESDGLLNVTAFPPESFDKILLDPPCSALGLRPKLGVPQVREKDLESFANYQKRFIREAIDLLRPGSGILTYSTCSINATENEANVCFILDEYRHCMELVPITLDLGSPGLAGWGLNDRERQCVRRFDSYVSHGDNDVMGFFMAKFRKREKCVF